MEKIILSTDHVLGVYDLEEKLQRDLLLRPENGMVDIPRLRRVLNNTFLDYSFWQIGVFRIKQSWAYYSTKASKGQFLHFVFEDGKDVIAELENTSDKRFILKKSCVYPLFYRPPMDEIAYLVDIKNSKLIEFKVGVLRLGVQLEKIVDQQWEGCVLDFAAD